MLKLKVVTVKTNKEVCLGLNCHLGQVHRIGTTAALFSVLLITIIKSNCIPRQEET